jgi:HlyD family secretion protein
VIIDEVNDAVRAPLGALFRTGDRWSAYKVLDGRAALTQVEIGVADGTYREIKKGLAAGDTVIVFPGGAITDGARVRSRGK